MKKPITPEQQNYQDKVSQNLPKSRVLPQCLRAFVAGGAICVIGQLLRDAGGAMGLNGDGTAAFTAITLVFLGALFTGVGVYDKLGAWAGAGSVVPITGFANSVVAPAMEYKREGLILGVGAKLFTIAGPVLVYGITASVAVGLVYWIFGIA